MSRDRVPEGEQGVVRVYAIEAEGAALKPWLDPEAGDWPLPEALGVEALAPADVQAFAVRDIAELGLADFLAAGYGVEEAALADLTTPDTGGIAVIRSAAFGGEAVELAPVPPLRPLGIFREPQAVETFARMPEVKSARPRPGATRKAEPAPTDRAGKVIETFQADRRTYLRAHLWMAGIGAVAAPVVLMLIGAGDAWVGAPAAVAAIAVRGWYLASEELGTRWELTKQEIRLITPQGETGRRMGLGEIETVRTLGSTVQVVSKSGEKALIKYLADSEAARDRIARAAKVTR